MNNKRKKVLVLALLLFVAIGFAGYGVYSYYYTTGSFGAGDSGNDNLYLTGKFDPEVTAYSNGSNKSFLSGENHFFLECSDIDSNSQTTCSGTLYIHNDGSTSISLSVSNLAAYFNGSEISSGNVSYSLGDSNLSAGYSTTLSVTVSGITVPDGLGSSSEPVFTSSPVSEAEYSVEVRYSLRADD